MSHHFSIFKEVFEKQAKFLFVHCTYENACDEMRLLWKAFPKTTIPLKIIKDNCNIFALKLNDDLNHCIYRATFPNDIKQADVTPVHKKVVTDKPKYVSILPTISKIYEWGNTLHSSR